MFVTETTVIKIMVIKLCIDAVVDFIVMKPMEELVLHSSIFHNWKMIFIVIASLIVKVKQLEFYSSLLFLC